jgi:hypothetical protein
MPRKYTRKNNRRRVKRGGDIESGTVQEIAPMTSVPPDPERFTQQQQQMVRESLKPVSKQQVEAVFAGPTPEEKEKMNAEMMMDEDPLNKDPWSQLNIFSDKGGRRSRKSTHRRSRRTRRRQASRRRR